METIKLYREDEVVELVVKYLLANKQQEEEKKRKQKVRQIVTRQRKRRILREAVTLLVKQIIAIIFFAVFPWLLCKVTGDGEYYNMYLMSAPIAAGLIWNLFKGNWRI